MISKAHPTARAILRCIPQFSIVDLIHQYKTHVLCHLELNIGAFYHATDTTLAPLDAIQTSFLRDIGISVKQAFLEFNLAPPCLRRDIGMLGFIYNALNTPSQDAIKCLFKRQRRRARTAPHSRLYIARHTMQLEERRCPHSPALFKRSIFGLTRIWNLLPQHVVSADSVSSFQGPWHQ